MPIQDHSTLPALSSSALRPLAESAAVEQVFHAGTTPPDLNSHRPAKRAQVQDDPMQTVALQALDHFLRDIHQAKPSLRTRKIVALIAVLWLKHLLTRHEWRPCTEDNGWGTAHNLQNLRILEQRLIPKERDLGTRRYNYAKAERVAKQRIETEEADALMQRNLRRDMREHKAKTLCGGFGLGGGLATFFAGALVGTACPPLGFGIMLFSMVPTLGAAAVLNSQEPPPIKAYLESYFPSQLEERTYRLEGQMLPLNFEARRAITRGLNRLLRMEMSTANQIWVSCVDNFGSFIQRVASSQDYGALNRTSKIERTHLLWGSPNAPS
jgi:hypothetical protein